MEEVKLSLISRQNVLENILIVSIIEPFIKWLD